MARWEITIRQPTGSTPAIPALTVSQFQENGYNAVYLEQVELKELTLGQAGIFEGNPVGWRRLWNIKAVETEASLDRFNALLRWQSSRIASSLDGRLEIIDEIEYTMPEPTASVTKTLLAGSAVSPFTGFTKGFGIYRVIIKPEAEHGLQLSVEGGVNIKGICFSATEVPVA